MSARSLRAIHISVLCAVLGVGVLARSGAVERAADWRLSIAPVLSPAQGSSAQPQIAIQGDQAVLSWLERDGTRATLKFAERTPSGWSESRVVASGDDFFVNWADVPSVLRLADGALAAHWLQKSGSGTYAYDVRLSWSRDNGRTWTPSVTPHHDGTKTEHGFASLFQAPHAGLGLVWLDGRAMNPHAHDGHDGKDAGAMSVRAAVFERDGSQRSEMAVDARVCECCPTATAVTSEGVIAAFRDRTGDEVRDIYVARLVDGKWSEPVAVHRDNWKITGCPVNGPALSAIGRDVAIAWFTAQGEQGRTFVAFSSDAGRSFGPPLRVDDEGSLGRVDAELLPDGSAVVSWIEFADQRAQFRVRRVDRSGARSASVSVAGIGAGRASGYPRMARRGNELLFAWTETADGASRVLTAAAPLPVAPTATRSAEKVTMLRVPHGGIQPQVAVDEKGILHLIYFDGDPSHGDLYYVHSADAGTSFSDPIRINHEPGSAIAVGNVRGAHLAVGPNGRIHVAWNGTRTLPSDGASPGAQRLPMLYTRMNDTGTAFEPERNVIQSSYGIDGGGAVAADRSGRVYVLWHAPAPGLKGEENRRVWMARSSDDGKTFDRERPAFAQPTGACGCCGMGAIADRTGSLYVLFRSATEMIHRDIYLLTSADGGDHFQGANIAPWNVGACVMSTESFSESPAGVLAAWEQTGQVYYGVVNPLTKKMTSSVPAPGEGTMRKHPVVVGNRDGEILLAWTEGMAWQKSGSLSWQVFDASGRAQGETIHASGIPVWSLVAAFVRLDGRFTVVY